MTLALTLVLITLVAFQTFCNGFILSDVFHLADDKNLSFWKAWKQEVEENGWTGWKAFPTKIYYFVPVIIALVSKKASNEERN